jgi:hypothetical protein
MRIQALATGHDGHTMRAFLLASATTAFCQPDRSLSASARREIGSLRVWAVLTTDLAPWIGSVRR